MKKRIMIGTILAAALALSACNLPLAKGEPTATVMSEAELMSTAVASVMQAMSLTQAAQPTPTQQPTLPPTPTVMMMLPTNTVAAGTLPNAAAQACNSAEFVSETIKDGTYFELGEAFTKTWTFKNSGTCTWNTNYRLVFVSGDWLEAPPYVNLTQAVAPGAQITVSVPMRAPYEEGTFTGYWALQGEDGVNFNTGNSVKITTAKDAFRVTSVSFSGLDDIKKTCPMDIDFTISFSVSGSGLVEYTVYYYYYPDYNTAFKTDHYTLRFDSSGTKTETFDFPKITETKDYGVKVYVDTPNNQWFGPDSFGATCK